MKIAVVGATGHTGDQVVEQALARGDEVTACCCGRCATIRSRALFLDTLAGLHGADQPDAAGGRLRPLR
jgi:nucleoside-diphosphate-sugar epimerase